MKNKICLLLSLLIIFICCGCGNSEVNLEEEIKTTVSWVKEATPAATMASIGGDWAVKGIVESGIEEDGQDDYFAVYFDDVRAQMKSAKGIIDEKYYTTYGRVIIGVTSIGEDPTDIEGYSLVEPLDDAEKVLHQGMNAASYALIGGNLAGVKLENEDKYIDCILNEMKKNKFYADKDMMDYASIAMEGLSFYQEREDVRKMIDLCIEGLSDAQMEDGSLGNCESTAEAIIALTSVGVDPVHDERFIKDGHSMLDGLLIFKGDHGYLHTLDEEGMNQFMTTEKALLALDSIRLFNAGEKFYHAER